MLDVVVYAYSQIGHECLKTLITLGAKIVGVFTHEDNPHETIWFPSVATLGRQHGLRVYSPVDPNTTTEIQHLHSLAPEIIFSFYYRSLLTNPIIQYPRLGAFNLHGSLLPRYRGRSPVHWAIIKGETQTGATLHHMTAKPDAGDIVDQLPVSIDVADTALDVTHKVAGAACHIVTRQWGALMSGTAPRIAQDNTKASYFGGRGPQDGLIHWPSSSKTIYNLIRAVTRPFPGAFTPYAGKQMIIWRAKPYPDTLTTAPGTVLSQEPFRIACGEGFLEILDHEITTQRSFIQAGITGITS